MTPEQTVRSQFIRGKAIAGTASMDELREGIAILRADRVGAQIASTSSRTKKAADAASVDTSALLSNLKLIGQKLTSGPVA